jgi:aminoglycoside phosphotransferase (APT) family kinase protein
MSTVSNDGRLMAHGRWTDVYDLGGGRILKHYRDPAGEPIAAFEAAVLAYARAHGVPVPEVFDVRGGDLTLEKIAGPTMLRDVTRHPRTMPQHARTLAALHRVVHTVTAPEGLQQPFGPGGALLHLDLHPDNVILSPSGPVLIDWQGAVAGPPAADVAHTWLLIRTSVVPGPLLQRAVGSVGQRLFARAFLDHVNATEARQQFSAVAARRLRDPSLLDAEASRIRRLVKTFD